MTTVPASTPRALAVVPLGIVPPSPRSTDTRFSAAARAHWLVRTRRQRLPHLRHSAAAVPGWAHPKTRCFTFAMYVRDVMIEEAVAVGDREVTVGLWNEFLRPRVAAAGGRGRAPARDLSWYEAVAFCRWLTEQAGMTEADQCYRMPATLERTSDGLVKNWEFDPERRGFRLPTDAEWEAACRAGTRDAYSFGNDPALLDRHGWFLGPMERRRSRWPPTPESARPVRHARQRLGMVPGRV